MVLRIVWMVFCLWAVQAAAQEEGPTPAMAARLLDHDGAVTLTRIGDGVPGWIARGDGRVLGHLGSTSEIAGSVGYSGRPLDVLVAVDPQGVISGAELVRHNEPVLTLGISDQDIAAYVGSFAGYDLTRPPQDSAADLPDVISRATVSTGVIRDGILRTARTLAIGRGIIAASGGIDRVGFRPMTWDDLTATGALVPLYVSLNEAAQELAGARVPPAPGDGAFIDIRAGLVDPPTVGQNLLGQQEFTRAVGNLGPGETMLAILSAGVHSPRGTEWRRSGVFDRLRIVQGDTVHQPRAGDFHLVKRLAIAGAPTFREIGLYRLPPAIDPLRPFSVQVTASRPAADGGAVTLGAQADYTLPQAFRTAPPPEPEPLWRQAWRDDRPEIAVVAALLAVLGLVFLFQEAITRRPKLWRYGRIGFLSVTFVVLGLGLNGQLSIVQVVAFLHALLEGFRWETFLIEPVIFLLWGFVALGLLFWGRGVYCGWLCPFGALQELLNGLAVKLGVKQVAVPQALHERLWIIKYTLFVAIVALSFYSMRDALILAEAEPFKTAISMRMLRAWPFVLFVLVLLAAGLFIERFYCRYLCPLGAGLAIPAKLKIFDWLHRRPQCGRECRLCETKCTVGAIDSVGRINPNECVLCLRCQVIMSDGTQCPVLKRRARAGG
ncbi:NosR/NirI family transcriptional regulator, nitrite reductase regulator [Lutimaribacter pacificus]|uniref:NosR/NirI family transcriptional regulator, nitrite reductase regulator n=1 Tax=Lutimaribacter pacificus TaxID=391948 RepID=A0A1H0IZM3_9RHOB|nr:NosR/NirI family protein [Lutimaribacter pacificus]SDO36968.1 NosR/NirI family transcriptional regulator, nitrite reductase regulator [Lutimaribacter pacificus]SHK15710.1 NosR/NirI family transcriptional regulator, nitrite reductase regulator [Lutimaribacter pacificus]